MEKMKLVSIRIPEDELNELDRLAGHLSYYDRSELIRAAVRVLIGCHKFVGLRRFVGFFPRWGDKVDSFEFTYHREVN